MRWQVEHAREPSHAPAAARTMLLLGVEQTTAGQEGRPPPPHVAHARL